MGNPLDFEEETIPFEVNIKGSFYYRYKPNKFDADKAKEEIYEILSDAINKFEAFDGDILVGDVNYNIEA